MSSFSRRAGSIAFTLGLIFLVGGSVRCGPGPKNCERYSDCDPGRTCAYGRCVYPPGEDAGPEASLGGLDAESADTSLSTGSDGSAVDAAAASTDSGAASSADASSD